MVVPPVSGGGLTGAEVMGLTGYARRGRGQWNDEIRMTNDESGIKLPLVSITGLMCAKPQFSSFVIRHSSFVIRHSSFVIRHFAFRLLHSPPCLIATHASTCSPT